MKTANINVRIEAPLKDEAEAILETLGLSRSQAITLFYKQIVLQKGLPFDIKIPGIPDFSSLSDEEILIEIQKGIDDIKKGKTIPFEEAFRRIEEEYNLK